jgi:outer membrane protein
MNRTLVVLLVCSLGWPGLAGSAEAEGAKIGVFDSQRVSEETAEGRRVQTQLKQYLDRKQAEINAKEKELGELQQQLNTQTLSLSEDKRASMESEVQRKLLELNSLRDAAMREWQLERSEAGGRFEKQLLRVVQELGRREGFTVLFDRSQVAYAADAVDVTTAIVDLFNQMTPQPPAPEAKGN